MGSVSGNRIYNSPQSMSWYSYIEYSTTSASFYIHVDLHQGTSGSMWLKCDCYIDGEYVGQLGANNYSAGNHFVGSKSISASSHSFSGTCSGGSWGQDGTSSGTIPAQSAIVNVDPKINGTTYASGLDGFTFNMSGKVTETNKKDYYNDSAAAGTYTATPNAKTGYTTTAATGNATLGNRLDLYPEWNSVQTVITLNSDGATSHGTTSVTGKYDQAMPTITPPSLTSATFMGYFSQPNGQGTKYYKADGTSNTNWDDTTGTATTLYAYFEYTTAITLNSDGATTHGTTSVNVRYGNAMTTITVPTRANADFLGYFSQPNGQGTKYYKADGTSNTNWDNNVATYTLYAAWEFHDFIYASKNGGSYVLCQMYVSKNGGAYTLVDASMAKISKNGSSYTNIV